MALLNITDADRKMAINSAMVGAGAVTSISVANWVKSQSWAPKLVTDHIDITTALAGVPVYALGRKQKGQLKDVVQSLGAGMVVGLCLIMSKFATFSAYRFMVHRMHERQFKIRL
jgi:hypothetical protein